MIDHLYISIALFALSIGTGLVVISSNMKTWRKILVVTMLAASSILSYRAMFFFYGYPVPLQESFDKVLVLGFKAVPHEGITYIWLQEGGKEPRSYVIPYVGDIHKELRKMRRQTKGAPFRINIEVKTSLGRAYRNSIDEIKIKGAPLFPQKR